MGEDVIIVATELPQSLARKSRRPPAFSWGGPVAKLLDQVVMRMLVPASPSV